MNVPAPGTYNPDDHFTNHLAPQYSFGTGERSDPTVGTLTSLVDCNPSQKLTIQASPNYSLGYKNDPDHINDYPAPGSYFSTILTAPRVLNTEERYFTTSSRVDIAKGNNRPGVGAYEVTSESTSPKIKFGISSRKNASLNTNPPPGAYQVAGSPYKLGNGKTFGQKLPVVENKNDFPSPNKYLPALPTSKISFSIPKSNRPSPIGKDAILNPSPSDYNVSKQLQKGVHFTKGKRSEMFSGNNRPGPDTYQSIDIKSSQSGVINPEHSGRKYARHEYPSPATHSPKTTLVQTRGSNARINLTSQRTDFSHSPTKRLGPGAYQLSGGLGSELGRMGKSQKLKQRVSQMVLGPGDYDFPPTLGHIPYYYRELVKKIGLDGQTKNIKYHPREKAKPKIEEVPSLLPKVA